MNRIAPLCALALAVLAVPARADEFDVHEARAGAALESERYEEAASELSAAFALRQAPRLLYQLGYAQQRLGHRDSAIAYYRRFLVAETFDEPRRAEAQRALDRLLAAAPVPDPRTAAQLPGTQAGQQQVAPFHWESHSNRGLVGAGIAVLATSYAAAFISGTLFGLTESGGCCRSDGNLSAAGWTLVIPVIGPFVSGLVYREAFWSVPWMLVDGLSQVSGLVMIIAGARDNHKVAVLGPEVTLAPVMGQGLAGLTLRGRF